MMGVFGSIFALTWAIGPILGGYVMKSGFDAAYAMVGGFFIAALLVSFLKERLAK